MKTNKFFLFLVLLALCVMSYSGIKIHKKYFKLPQLTVLGFINMSDGLGRQSVELIQALKDDVEVGFKSTRPSNLRDVPEPIVEFLKTSKKKWGKIVIYEDVLYPISHTYFTKKFKGCPDSQIRFAYTMLESSQIPKRWALTLNKHFDAALVPDEFLVKVYKDSGVTIPIFVVPLGLNLEEFEKKPLKKAANIPFTFANFGTCISRKNHEDLVLAFNKAFGDDQRVRLWINCKYSADNLFENLKELVHRLDVKNIILTNECFSKEEYINNYDNVDCYVNTTKSEGFSIQPREAMALGIPCIVSDNTAQSTICKSGLVKSVPTSHTEPAYYEFFADISGERYVPDFDKTTDALLEVYNNYEKYLMKSLEMRNWALQYKYKNLHDIYKTLVKPKNVKLSEKNCVEGDTLYTDSENLYKKYKKI